MYLKQCLDPPPLALKLTEKVESRSGGGEDSAAVKGEATMMPAGGDETGRKGGDDVDTEDGGCRGQKGRRIKSMIDTGTGG